MSRKPHDVDLRYYGILKWKQGTEKPECEAQECVMPSREIVVGDRVYSITSGGSRKDSFRAYHEACYERLLH